MKAYKQPFGFYYFSVMLPLDALACIIFAVTSKTIWAGLGFAALAVGCLYVWYWMLFAE